MSVRRTGEFNVLTPEEVHAIARADGSELFGALFVTVAFTGLRMGELRALRWSDIDFGKRVVYVRRSFTGSSFGAPKSQRVRSVPVSDPVARVLDGLSHRGHDTRPDDLVFSSAAASSGYCRSSRASRGSDARGRRSSASRTPPSPGGTRSASCPGSVRILDDRSANGTWVNGRRVAAAELRDGDIITLGAVALTFRELA